MAKLDKIQRDYVLSRLSKESSKAVNEFTKSKPTAFTTAEVKEQLEKKGFIVQDRNYFYVSLPPTKQMEKNAAAIEEFKASVYEAEQEAKDKIYLSDAEGALEIVEQFVKALNKL